jgi:hypothetical protein
MYVNVQNYGWQDSHQLSFELDGNLGHLGWIEVSNF